MKSKSLILFGLFSLTSMGFAAESPWEFTGAAGLSYTDGNSDSLAYSLQFLGSYKQDAEEAYIGMDYFFSEDEVEKSTDSLRVFGQYNHDLNDLFYVGAYGSYYQDKVADIDYRYDTSLILGYRAIKSDDMNLTFEVGPGYSWEKKSTGKRDFTTLRFAERFDYQLTSSTKFWQTLGFTPKASNFGTYLIDFEAGVETRINNQWALRTFVKHRRDSKPALGRGHTDTALMVGVSYDFNGLPEPEAADSSRRSLMPTEKDTAVDALGWTSVAALGFTLNKGNADSMGLTLTSETAYRSAEEEFFLDIAQTFRENDSSTSENKTIGRIQYNRLVTDHCYFGAAVGYLRDSEADISYRVTPGFIAGYYLIKDNTTTLAVEAGPGYTFERVGGQKDDFVSVVAGERFTHKFNERFVFNQTAQYLAEIDKLNNYSLLFTAALDTKISDSLIWRTGFTYTYESKPAAARHHHDSAITTSVAVKF